MEETVESVLRNMSSVNFPQQKFMTLIFQGKANFRNLSRYCSMHEKRFSRWYRRSFDFVTFNHTLLRQELPSDTQYIAAIDASFMRKSGKCTEGLGWFYHSQSSKAEQGLEISLISAIDLKAHTAYSLDARQTLDSDDGSRVDSYGAQIKQLGSKLKDLGPWKK